MVDDFGADAAAIAAALNASLGTKINGVGQDVATLRRDQDATPGPRCGPRLSVLEAAQRTGAVPAGP